MEENYFTYDAAANLMLAYRTLCDLKKIAHDSNIDTVSMISEELNGTLTFFIPGVSNKLGGYHVTDILTEEKSIFEQKIADFKAYWEGLMQKENETKAGRIAALKAELAKLEA